MNIRIATPAPPRSRSGNRATALRWARILRKLGHAVSVVQVRAGEGDDERLFGVFAVKPLDGFGAAPGVQCDQQIAIDRPTALPAALYDADGVAELAQDARPAQRGRSIPAARSRWGRCSDTNIHRETDSRTLRCDRKGYYLGL